MRETTINTMILAGFIIALGAVVDDAIVGVENTLRRLRENNAKGGRKRRIGIVVLEASYEVRKAILFSTAIEVFDAKAKGRAAPTRSAMSPQIGGANVAASARSAHMVPMAAAENPSFSSAGAACATWIPTEPKSRK